MDFCLIKLYLHNWILKKIVGKKTVIMNATIQGSIELTKNNKALIVNNKINGSKQFKIGNQIY